MKRCVTPLVRALIFLAMLQITTSISLAQDGIMPISEISPGMCGVGKTVVSGVEVEEFDVEVLGILQDSNQELILVRVSGPVIDRTGGIAAGMSGSPVYIDGKLIGAIGYGWSLTDHRIGMVTPIESMLKVLQMSRPSQSKRSFKIDFDRFQTDSVNVGQGVLKQYNLSAPLIIDDQVISQIYFCDSYSTAKELQITKDSLTAYPVNTPLLVNGLKGRALDRLMEDLENFDLFPVETGSSSGSTNGKEELVSGSAVAVQLVRGDVNVSAIGTLTYISELDEVLAFGHPFLSLGQVEYLLSSAEILGVIDSIDMPFKLGIPTGVVGVITQDRNAGVGGKLAQNPKVIPVNVLIEDYNLENQEEYQFQIVRNEELFVSLATSALLQTIDSTMDRQGYGTSKLRVAIVGDKLPDQFFTYENMYYSGYDIASDSLYDLYNILSHIMNNPFVKVNVGSIDVQLQIEQIRQVALIEGVKLLNDKLFPGDTAAIQVTFRPYRAEPFKLTYEIEIPETIPAGPASLTVSGGVYGSYGYIEDYSTTEEGTEPANYAEGEYYQSLEEILSQYQNEPKNNELIIEIMPYYIEVLADDSTEESSVTTKDSKQRESEDEVAESMSNNRGSKQNITDYYPTEYILEGSLTLEINIQERDSTSIKVMGEQKPNERYKIPDDGNRI